MTFEDLANEMGVSQLLAQHPKIYGLLREELNNEMLSRWEEEQEGGAPPWRIGREYPYSEFDRFVRTEYGPERMGENFVVINIDGITYSFVYSSWRGEGMFRCIYVK